MAAALPESYPSGVAEPGTSMGLCHGQCLSDQQWCLVVAYIPPQSSCFTSLTHYLLCVPFTLSYSWYSFNYLPSALFTLLSYFSQYFHPKFHIFSLCQLAHLGQTATLWTLYLSLHNQGEERHRVEMRNGEWGWLHCSCSAASQQG